MEIYPEISDLAEILVGRNTKYTIPPYQRDYSWKYNNEVEELWADLFFAFENNSEYFIGNIVLNSKGVPIKNAKEFDIVDGQQRITTFSILFKVINDYINFYIKTQGQDKIFVNWNVTESDNDIIKSISQISNDRLMYYGRPNQFYLQLNQKDQPIFKDEVLNKSQILRNDEDWKILTNEHRLLKTKKFFAQRVFESFINIPDGFKTLLKFLEHIVYEIKINSIKVGGEYDAYLLFESLNSKGMSLSQSDLIKNKMLMICKDDSASQESVFENWNKVILNVKQSKNDNIVDFFYYYWLAFEDTPVTKKTLYKSMRKKLLKMSPKEVDKFSKSLVKTSTTYSKITSSNFTFPSNLYKSNSLESFLSEIQYLKYSICIPVILYSYHNEIKITKEITKLSLSYLFRTITIGELQVRKAKDTFDAILKYLKKDPKPKEGRVLQIFKENLEIDDLTLKNKFTQKTFSNSLAKYSLTKILQNQLGSETIPHEVDLEHILPQSHNDYWNDFDFKKRKTEDVINNIGNLTLINPRSNKKVQNYSFDKKVEFYKKRTIDTDEKSTTISLTYKIHDEFIEESKKKRFIKNEFWNVEKIDKRASELAKNINKIWSI